MTRLQVVWAKPCRRWQILAQLVLNIVLVELGPESILVHFRALNDALGQALQMFLHVDIGT